jgi:catechol 2,3-dioxygenase-like lactoylglutathione lyase family enzyme
MFNHITHSAIFVTDQDAALEYYVDKLGLEVSADVDLGVMRWLTVCVPGENRHILLEKPGPPAHDEATAAQVRELLGKGGTGMGFILTTEDAHATYAELKAKGVETLGEPVDMPYGIDFGVRDPFGNNLRITQPNEATQEEIQAAYQSAGA